MLLSRVELIAQTLDMNFFGFVKKGKVELQTTMIPHQYEKISSLKATCGTFLLIMQYSMHHTLSLVVLVQLSYFNLHRAFVFVASILFVLYSQKSENL